MFFEIPAAIFSMYVAYWVAHHELRLAHLERLTEDTDPPAADREQPSSVDHSD